MVKGSKKQVKPCSVVGCERPSVARGLCGGHLQRLAIHGDVRPHIKLGDKRGSLNPRWQGGIKKVSENRTQTYSPDHPLSRNGYVLTYRLVAEKKLGRFLTETEVVHHINGDVTDNSPDNLEVMTQAEHASRHSPDRKRNSYGQYI